MANDRQQETNDQTTLSAPAIENYKQVTFTKLVNLVEVALTEQEAILKFSDDLETKQTAIDSVLDRAGLPRHKTVTTNVPQGTDGNGSAVQPEVIEGLVKGLASVFGIKDVDNLNFTKQVGSNTEPNAPKQRSLKDII